eukprot:2836913-Rhodomonas_salina.4
MVWGMVLEGVEGSEESVLVQEGLLSMSPPRQSNWTNSRAQNHSLGLREYDQDAAFSKCQRGGHWAGVSTGGADGGAFGESTLKQYSNQIVRAQRHRQTCCPQLHCLLPVRDKTTWESIPVLGVPLTAKLKSMGVLAVVVANHHQHSNEQTEKMANTDRHRQTDSCSKSIASHCA